MSRHFKLSKKNERDREKQLLRQNFTLSKPLVTLAIAWEGEEGRGEMVRETKERWG